MSRRVVITGLGVVAPNANDVQTFELALRKGKSGLRANALMKELKFGCHVAAVPQGVDEIASSMFDEDLLLVRWQRGYLRDLLRDGPRRRPNYIDEDEDED